MRINKRVVAVVAVIIMVGVGVGFVGGFAYRESLIQDFVNVWFQEFHELPEGIESVPVFAQVEVWYEKGTIDRFSTFTWRWGDGGYGPEEMIPRGTILQVKMRFLIDATWNWMSDTVTGVYEWKFETQYIAGTRTEFFSNTSYGIYGYVVGDYDAY
jgi:hypothetical protein